MMAGIIPLGVMAFLASVAGAAYRIDKIHPIVRAWVVVFCAIGILNAAFVLDGILGTSGQSSVRFLIWGVFVLVIGFVVSGKAE